MTEKEFFECLGKISNMVNDIDRMNLLKKENEELKEYKKDKNRIEEEYEIKINELNRKIETAERDAKNARLRDLIETLAKPLYSIECKKEYKKDKCNKCDEQRNIKFTSPSGKILSEPCECAETKLVHIVKEQIIYEFNTEREEVCCWYTKKYKENDIYEFKYHMDKKYLDLTVEEIEKVYGYKKEYCNLRVYKYDFIFFDKEKCQKACEYFNKKGL